jgi:beta-N-acetylhexosaminidase
VIQSRRRSLAATGAAAALVGALVVAAAAPARPAGTTAPVAAAAPAVCAVATPRTAETVLASMTLRQRIGQLFMVGTPATSASSATLSAITDRHVGNVILTGRSYGGTATPARVAAALQARATEAATGNVDLFLATDQEGGQVQVLNGRGISDMPSALQQGRWSPDRLHREATTWAAQLRSAGVNMNLAPVVDTVPSARAAQDNPPIGAYDREFGYTTRVVGNHGRAFLRAMDASGVAPSLKHFPGLGRVHANPDTSTGVTDRVTTRHDAYLAPFRTAIDAGAPFVMMSTAYYSRIDARNPAAFSPFVIGTVLRRDLGFTGVVISDDLANARQVSPWTWGQRAVAFLGAGGNLVLTVNPASLPAMYRAVLRRAQDSPVFRAKVNASALKVLQAKEARDLL